jgi:Dipeptidyl aminopeptidases/acylaminoacyl-peptidases
MADHLALRHQSGRHRLECRARSSLRFPPVVITRCFLIRAAVTVRVRTSPVRMQDFGGGDLRDDLAGVDAAMKKYPIDPNRLGVMGWSYGGFMTMWTVTQTDRFRAAVAGAGIANWQSYYGQNLIGQWMIPFFGASVYDDPAVYEKSSPIRFIKNVKTPTLVIVGERDAECPASQSYEFWHALRR